MQTRVRALGHSVHPMLVAFPLAMFIGALIFDAIRFFSDNDTYGQVGFWMITVGLVGAVLAASTGLLDYTKIPAGTRAKALGIRHGLLNALVTVAFLISWLVRVGADAHNPGGGLVLLELIAVGVAGVSAWLGGELVERLGIGVHRDARPDAPSSLRTPSHIS